MSYILDHLAYISIVIATFYIGLFVYSLGQGRREERARNRSR